MVGCSKCLSHYTTIVLILFIVQTSQSHPTIKKGMKTDVFLSPKFVLQPGLVSNKFYYNINFPKGHIAIKSFNAEVIDEKGNSIPLHETYLHHWIVVRYYQRKGLDVNPNRDLGSQPSNHIIVKNSGLCDHGLVQYFGLGSETRLTDTDVPDPYGIEVGNPKDVPEGYEERWMLNVHAIDTRAAEDKKGCTECRRDLYNVSVDQSGRVLPANYRGGLKCCHDGARCGVREGYEGVERSLYLRYIVKYVEWSDLILPVKIFILDVTDMWSKEDELRGRRESHQCLIEYEVEPCPAGTVNNGCTHTKTLTASLPSGGDVIYAVGHQHLGGIGSTLYGEGGRVICTSIPIYGTGDEPGNEAGYIVGMSTCYPTPGSIKISAGEKLTLVSNYSSAQRHTGVMGLFYLLISDSSQETNAILYAPAEAHKIMITSGYMWAIALFGVGVILVVIFTFKMGKSGKEEGYEAIVG